MLRMCGNKNCGQTKPLAEFYKNKRGPDGFDYRCKECRKSAVMKHTKEHKQERLSYNREYKKKNAEKISEYNKSYLANYYKENRQEMIDASVEYKRNKRKTINDCLPLQKSSTSFCI